MFSFESAQYSLMRYREQRAARTAVFWVCSIVLLYTAASIVYISKTVMVEPRHEE